MIFNICGTTKIKTNFVTKIHPDLPMLIVGLLLCGLLLTFLLYNVKIYLGRMPLSHIPSPALGLTPLWFLGHLPLFSAKIEKTHSYFHAFVSIQKDIGEEVIALFFLSANIIFCTNIDMAGKILLDHRVFMKMTKKAQQAIGFGTHYVGGNRVFGPRGIAFEPGTDVWYFKRKTMDPAFHKKYLRTLLEDMNELSDSFISHLQKKIIGQPSVDIFPMFCKFTLDIVCKCSFSLDVGAMASEVSPLNDAANEIFQVIQLSYDSLSWNLPWTFKKEKALLKSRIDFVHSMLRDTLKKRLESQVQYEDTLSYIINANLFDEKRPQSEIIADILDDFWTILFAGMETTANALAYCMFYMLKNPDIYGKARDEVDEVLAGRTCLDYEDLERLVYMEQIIKEVLRRHTPGAATFRVPYKDSPTVCGTVVPKGGSSKHRANA